MSLLVVSIWAIYQTGHFWCIHVHAKNLKKTIKLEQGKEGDRVIVGCFLFVYITQQNWQYVKSNYIASKSRKNRKEIKYTSPNILY